MRSIILVVLIVFCFITSLTLSVIPSMSSSYACSVFAKETSKGDFIIAKNFDWLPGKDYIVENPRNQIRHFFYNNQKTWAALYSSYSFTTFGPGLPISSMNEKGLIVETLLDFDSDLSVKPIHEFISLEWAQYILDNFSTIAEVLSFSKNNAFDQLVVPVHFFICDIKKECAVIETRQQQITVTTGADLKETVLANNGWKKDFTTYKNKSLSRLFNWSLLNPYSSSKRFSKLANKSKSSNLNNSKKIFALLDQSKITPLTEWQIIWTPHSNHVIWRQFQFRKAQEKKSFQLNPIQTCSPYLMVRDMNSHKNRIVFDLTKIKSLRKHLKSIMIWKTGNYDKDLTNRIIRYTISSRCNINKPFSKSKI